MRARTRWPGRNRRAPRRSRGHGVRLAARRSLAPSSLANLPGARVELHDIEAWAKSVGRLPSVERPAANCSPENLPELLSSDEVATRIGTTAGAVRARARRGQIPAPRWHIAGRAVWDSRDIDDWIAGCGPASFSSSTAR